jgi:hypothetical protein
MLVQYCVCYCHWLSYFVIRGVLLYCRTCHGAHLAASSFDVVADISVPTVGMYSGCTGDFSWLKLKVS